MVSDFAAGNRPYKGRMVVGRDADESNAVSNEEGCEPTRGSLGPTFKCDMNIFNHVKSRLFKVTLTVVAALLIVHYWRHVAFESHPLGPLFVINSAVNRARGMHTSVIGNLTGYPIDSGVFFNETSSHNVTGNATVEVSQRSNETAICPPIPPNLNGPIEVLKDDENFEALEKLFPELDPGGMYRPRDCKARYVVALVIPYRDRSKQLAVFLNNMHRLLMRQQIDYGIFVVEQEGDGPFNRGKLFNIGFVEALKIKQFDCFIFHDVDLIPEDDRNLYTCPEYPRHMSVAVNKFNYRLPYKDLFGGVSAMSTLHFQLANGFSNMFWGWGGEDDDMFNRVRRQGLHISRYPPTIARYTMLDHSKQNPNPKRFEILHEGRKRYNTDGLNSLKYERKALELRRLYTWILVDLQPPR